MLTPLRRLFILGALATACRHSPNPGGNESAPRVAAPLATPANASVPPRHPEPADASTLPFGGDASNLADAATDNVVTACNEQPAQAFLVNAHFNGRSLNTATERAEWKAAVQASIRYRTEQYGYFAGFGSWGWNTRPLRAQIHGTHFFGLVVRLHEKVIPALKCVEQALHQQCEAFPYQPHALSGVREKNTYFDGDVSNHVYGIAIDIDPLENPCCNCIEPWRSSPRCKGDKTDFERMAMPECWVKVFERFGFYWLGHDQLKDTMHFEFLGDPAKIAR